MADEQFHLLSRSLAVWPPRAPVPPGATRPGSLPHGGCALRQPRELFAELGNGIAPRGVFYHRDATTATEIQQTYFYYNRYE